MEDYSVEDLIYCAKVSEQVERYEQMVEFMRILINKGFQFEIEERNLLSVAYKNSVGPWRTSWRIIDTIEKKEK